METKKKTMRSNGGKALQAKYRKEGVFEKRLEGLQKGRDEYLNRQKQNKQIIELLEEEYPTLYAHIIKKLVTGT